MIDKIAYGGADLASHSSAIAFVDETGKLINYNWILTDTSESLGDRCKLIYSEFYKQSLIQYSKLKSLGYNKICVSFENNHFQNYAITNLLGIINGLVVGILSQIWGIDNIKLIFVGARDWQNNPDKEFDIGFTNTTERGDGKKLSCDWAETFYNIKLPTTKKPDFYYTSGFKLNEDNELKPQLSPDYRVSDCGDALRLAYLNSQNKLFDRGLVNQEHKSIKTIKAKLNKKIERYKKLTIDWLDKDLKKAELYYNNVVEYIDEYVTTIEKQPSKLKIKEILLREITVRKEKQKCQK